MIDPMTFAHRFWPSLRRGSRRGRSGLIVWAAIWVLLRLPVAVPDFHEVAHHHIEGAACLYHEHLNRWHGPVNPGDSAAGHEHELATLHWHWVIPGSNMPDGQSGQDDSQETAQDGPHLTQGSGGDFLSQVLESARIAATIDRTGSDLSELLELVGASLLTCVRFHETPPLCAYRALDSQINMQFGVTSASSRPLRC